MISRRQDGIVIVITTATDADTVLRKLKCKTDPERLRRDSAPPWTSGRMKAPDWFRPGFNLSLIGAVVIGGHAGGCLTRRTIDNYEPFNTCGELIPSGGVAPTR